MKKPVFIIGKKQIVMACMTMILHGNLRMQRLDARTNLAERVGTPNARHILQANFVGTSLDKLIRQCYIIIYGVYGAAGDAERCLRYHARLLGIKDGGNDIALIVQTTEDAGDVGTLRMLHTIEKLTKVLRARAHAKAIEGTVEHVGLNASLAEGAGPCTNRLVGILSEEEVHLLKASTIGLHAVKASHTDDDGCNFQQLVNAGLVLSSTLPHIAEYKAKLDFFHFLKVKEHVKEHVWGSLSEFHCLGDTSLSAGELCHSLLEEFHGRSIDGGGGGNGGLRRQDGSTIIDGHLRLANALALRSYLIDNRNKQLATIDNDEQDDENREHTHDKQLESKGKVFHILKD